MRLQSIILSMLLLEASAAPQARKRRHLDGDDHQDVIDHHHHAVSFFDSFFSFFGGSPSSSPVKSTAARDHDRTTLPPRFVPARGPQRQSTESPSASEEAATPNSEEGPAARQPRKEDFSTHAPIADFSIVASNRETTTKQTKSTPVAPIREPGLVHHHRLLDNMLPQQPQGAAVSTSPPTIPPVTTTVGFLPPQFARQGRPEVKDLPKFIQSEDQPIQQQPQVPGSQPIHQKQRQPSEPERPSPGPFSDPHGLTSSPKPGKLGRTPPAATKAASASPQMVPGMAPPVRIPNRPPFTTPAPTRSPRLPGQQRPTPLPSLPNPQAPLTRNALIPNIFAPLSTPIDPETCNTFGEVGQCSPAMQCLQQGGRVGTPCRRGGWLPMACCVFEQRQCGFQSSQRVSYFRSIPGDVTPPPSCGYRVNLLPRVCQVRLDFVDLQTKPNSLGLCDPRNHLRISAGPDQLAKVPISQLCGNISEGGQRPSLSTDLPHLYVHFDRLEGEKFGWIQPAHIQLDLLTDGHPSSWNIRVTQITCGNSRLQAPTGCSQYYTSIQGTMTSFGLSDGQYQANQDITACVASDPGACGIQYEMKDFQVGPAIRSSLGFGLVCTDYIKFLGEKTSVCGSARDQRMVLPARGPLGFTFRSDNTHVMGSDVGYNIGFKLLQDCSNVTFYKYPGKGSSRF